MNHLRFLSIDLKDQEIYEKINNNRYIKIALAFQKRWSAILCENY